MFTSRFRFLEGLPHSCGLAVQAWPLTAFVQIQTAAARFQQPVNPVSKERLPEFKHAGLHSSTRKDNLNNEASSSASESLKLPRASGSQKDKRKQHLS